MNRDLERVVPLIQAGRFDWLEHTNPTQRISRVIHQTYETRRMPEEVEHNVATIVAINRGWQHRFYDAADRSAFIADNYGSAVLGLYQMISGSYGAARADLFRYLVLYRQGGVYLDIKSAVTVPLDQKLREDDVYVLSQWDNCHGGRHAGFGLWKELAGVPNGEYQQWHIEAAAGHPFLRAVIEAVLTNIVAYKPWRAGTGRYGVFRVTGPIAYTLAIHPLRGTYPHRIVADETCLGLKYSIFEQTQHRSLFAQHYSKSTSPVVDLSGPDRVLGAAYGYVKGLRRRFLPRAND